MNSKLIESLIASIDDIKKCQIASHDYVRTISNIDEAINISEIEKLANSKLTYNAFGYYSTGANGEHTLRWNDEIFKDFKLMPRVLRNITKDDLTTTILGSKISSPICIAPSALHKISNEQGELATASAAFELNTAMILSTLSSTCLEEVAKYNQNGLRWMQLYIMKDRDHTIEFIRRIENSGYTALVLTVDAPTFSIRERELKVKFSFPEGIEFANLKKMKFQEKSEFSSSLSQLSEAFTSNIDGVYSLLKKL